MNNTEINTTLDQWDAIIAAQPSSGSASDSASDSSHSSPPRFPDIAEASRLLREYLLGNGRRPAWYHAHLVVGHGSTAAIAIHATDVIAAQAWVDQFGGRWGRWPVKVRGVGVGVAGTGMQSTGGATS